MFLKLMVILSIAISVNVLAKDDTSNFISVSGSCKKEVPPNRVFFDITIERLDMDQEKSSSLANQEYNSLLKEFRSLNLKDSNFKTTQYNIYPEKVYENRKQVFKGFKTVITLRTTTSETEKIGVLLGLVFKRKNLRVSTPSFFISDALYEKNYNDCLKIAFDKAEKKATILAQASDQKIKDVLSIHESSVSMPSPKPHYGLKRMSAVMEDASAPQIEAGKYAVKLSLAVSFSL